VFLITTPIYKSMGKHQKSYYIKNRNEEWYKQSNKEKCKRYRLKHPLLKLTEYANRRYKNKQMITPRDLFNIAKKQKLVCPLSGRKLTTENISIDHIVPQSKGGTNTVDNIRLTDKVVNISKNALNDLDFIKMCKEVAEFSSPLT